MKELDISKIFGSKCRAKIMEKLFLEYESGNNSGFHMRLLARDLDEQINSIKRELDSLEELGILKHKTELKKKIFFINPKFYLIDDFVNIFLKTYNPLPKIKAFFKNKNDLELVLVNESVKQKLVKPTKNILDIFLIGDIDREELSSFLAETFYGRSVKFTMISTENFFSRLEYGDKLVRDILNEKGNLFIKDNLKIKEKLNS